ncbi:DUF3307 domain-containing protein [Salipiger sp. P9]|uniref:DUF3307 domain-containing protein n=1 Tax=Salipiger pentaromativorans TaxID=2943193 RepID=UPI002158834C|nr:DUF3307 domain-containing protein [Salipiger pentaromativorans]MCR8547069.1 DUF3307 domain-containing protein [Salipiger pentaromativorans]
MIHSFAALLLAHMLADFVLQTRWMVQHKRHPGVMALHGVLVFALSFGALGGGWQVALFVTVAHLVIDALKTWALPDRLRTSLATFLADQAAHLTTLAAAALLWPGAAAAGIWAPWLAMLTAPAIGVAGTIATVLAGGHAVGLLMSRYSAEEVPQGLPDAGRLIGQLERAMILLLVMIGEPAGIGFLIAAKSVLRFDTATKEQKAGEYVIIGTLASFAWALAAAHATMALLAAIP